MDVWVSSCLEVETGFSSSQKIFAGKKYLAVLAASVQEVARSPEGVHSLRAENPAPPGSWAKPEPQNLSLSPLCCIQNLYFEQGGLWWKNILPHFIVHCFVTANSSSLVCISALVSFDFKIVSSHWTLPLYFHCRDSLSCSSWTLMCQIAAGGRLSAAQSALLGNPAERRPMLWLKWPVITVEKHVCIERIIAHSSKQVTQ